MKISTLLEIYKNRSTIIPLIKYHLMMQNKNEQNFWGSINDDDRNAIKDNTLKAANYPGPIIEIGALFGFTSQFIARHKKQEQQLIVVELFEWNPFMLSQKDHRLFTDRVLYYCQECCNLSIFEGSNKTFYKNYNGITPSMVFIDAEHTYNGVMVDIEWAKSMKIPIICGHDYHPNHPGVKRAVDESFLGNFKVKGSVWTAEIFS